MYDPGVMKVLKTLHDLEDASGGQGLVQLMMLGEIVVQALTLTMEERENMKRQQCYHISSRHKRNHRKVQTG